LSFIYPLTLFFNAALLFVVEPLIAKMILPFMGGSPAVWNTSLVFFQSFLLAGYAYAHFGTMWLGTKRHLTTHLLVALAALFFLPVALPVSWFGTSSQNPVTLVLEVLSVSIGLPFFVLCAGAPLLQKWFSQSGQLSSQDPYFLYAASNFGSLVGLVAYPTLIEPNLTLALQNRFWFYGYVVVLLLTSACAVSLLWRLAAVEETTARPAETARASSMLSRETAGEITWRRRLRWLALSAVPSSLLLGVTTYLTTDVASAPFFWMAPLMLYLFSFVVAFARPNWAAHTFVVRRQALLLLVAAITIFVEQRRPTWVILSFHFLAFFVTALVCHGELAKDRPAAESLTEFYLWISIGGVLGGAFNALFAPALFNTVLEYPLAMIAAAFLRPYVGLIHASRWRQWLDIVLPLTLGGIIIVSIRWPSLRELIPNVDDSYVVYGTAGAICLLFAYRPVRFGLGILAIMLAAALVSEPSGETLFTGRTFFGVYRVRATSDGKEHILNHGTTIHGTQNLAPSARLQPQSYYHRTGPAGQVFQKLGESKSIKNIAVVGLGAGTLACLARIHQSVTFFEIDPLVERIARDPRLFTYLKDCPPKKQIVIGDARLSLVKIPDRFFHLLVIDAFSSDAIPVHLLTQEAVKLYFDKIAPQGIILFHISNRFINLAPVLDRIASTLNLVALEQDDDEVSDEEADEGKYASHWVMIARQESVLASFAKDSRWQSLSGDLGGDLWTDEYSNILRAIEWR